MTKQKAYVECQFRTTRDVVVEDPFCSDPEDGQSRRHDRKQGSPKGVPTVPKYIITLTGSFGQVAQQKNIKVELLRLHSFEDHQDAQDWDIQSIDFITSCPGSPQPTSDVVGIKLHRVKFNTCSYRLRNTPFSIRVTFLKEFEENGQKKHVPVKIYSHPFRTLGRTPKSATTRSRSKAKTQTKDTTKVTKQKSKQTKKDVVVAFEKGLRSLLSQRPIDMDSLEFLHSVVARELNARSPPPTASHQPLPAAHQQPQLGLRRQRFEPRAWGQSGAQKLPSIGELGLGKSLSSMPHSPGSYYASDSSSSIDSDSDRSSSPEQYLTNTQVVSPFVRQHSAVPGGLEMAAARSLQRLGAMITQS